MKIYKYIPLLLLAVSPLLFWQCTDKYAEYNKTGVDDVEGDRDAYFLRQHLINMESWIIPVDVNAAQFTELLLGGNFGGYFADSNPGFNNRNFANFVPENAWIEPTFVNVYTHPITSYQTIQVLTKDPTFLAVAKVLKVMSLARVTDVYGPIPYTRLGGTDLTTPYDSQETVYEAMITDLNDAISVLSVNKEANFSAVADRIYGGRTLQWLKLANSLKLRLAVRMADVKPDLARSTAEAVIADPVGPMTANSDNAYLSLETGQKNFYQVVMVDYNGGDSRISADITSYMNGYNDPRRAKYFDQSAFGSYDGLRSGITIPTPQSIVQQYSNMKSDIRLASNIKLMNAAEVAFLRAEGALRGWNMGGTARSFYETGVNLSFEEWGATGAATYLADNTNTPGRYVDPLGKFSYSGTPSSVKVAWDDAAPMATNLERIITQKWIALYPNGIEAWSEHRRTGYPAFLPVVTNSSNVVSTARGARRLSYPQSEYTGNLENVRSAISQYLGGPDNMATDLWWAKKN